MSTIEQPPDLSLEATPPRTHGCLPFCLGIACVLLVIGMFSWNILTSAPEEFPVNRTIVVAEGSTLREITTRLLDEHVIRSGMAFAMLVQYHGAESRIMAGEYLFPFPLDLFGVAARLEGGERGVARMRITVPEGTSVLGMGKIFAMELSEFDNEQFLAVAKKSEGYLFPDTYFFFATATSGPVVDTLKENFVKKTDALYTEATANKKNWNDIVTMASIIEEETMTPADRRIVSGILWKRIAKRMPLQVDSPFAYAIGKNSATLTTVDLKTDSPYNTYRRLGLPPTPITNPGLDALDAALHPEASAYFYYLSDKTGTIHYAKTFEEHKLNKEKYLR